MRINRGNKTNGFSLVELLLTLVLILCLAAASVFSYTALTRTTSLDEGLNRLESLIRYAQAEAATTGCKVRLQFEEGPAELGEETALRKIRVTWEPDLLNSPGVFKVYTNKAWSEEIVNEVVGVEEVRPIGPPAPGYQPESSTAQLDPAMPSLARSSIASEDEMLMEPEFPAITFYPDGSCDSAELILASRDADDERRLQVRLSGILGSVSSRVISAHSSGDDFLNDFDAEAQMESFDSTFQAYPTEQNFGAADAFPGFEDSVGSSDYLE